MSCACRPTQKSDCSHLSFFINYFIICSVVLKTYTRPPTLTQRAPDGKWSHLSPARGRASLHSFHNKDFQMFSRLDGSSRCVATPSASWIMSWHRQFSFWNINKVVIIAAWQAGAPAGLLSLSSTVPPPSVGTGHIHMQLFTENRIFWRCLKFLSCQTLEPYIPMIFLCRL